MKTFIISLIFFILWFILWWWFGANFALNASFDSITNQLKHWIDLNFSWNVTNLNDKSLQIQEILNNKKDEFIQNLNAHKDAAIKKVQEDIKNKMRDRINNLF